MDEGALRVDANGTHAVTAWSRVHGLGTPILDGKMPRPESDHAMAAFTRHISGTLLEGLLRR